MKSIIKTLHIALVATMVLSISACETPRQNRAAKGGAIGAGVGAVGSAVLGGNPITGAVIGGGVGAVIGATRK